MNIEETVLFKLIGKKVLLATEVEKIDDDQDQMAYFDSVGEQDYLDKAL